MAEQGQDPMGFEGFSDFFKQTQMNPSNNDLVNRLFTVFSGLNTAPQVSGQQDVYDAYLQRERSRQFMTQIQRNAAINNQVTQFFGFNPNSPLVRTAGLTLGDPNGVYARGLSALTGSNPILAASNLYAGLTGSTVGAFGMNRNVTANEVSGVMDTFNRTFYTQRTVSNDWINNRVNDVVASTQQQMKQNPALLSMYGLNNPSQITADYLKSGSPHLAINATTVGMLQQGIDDLSGISSKTFGKTGDADIKQARIDASKKYMDQFAETLKGLPSELVKSYTKDGKVDLNGIKTAIASNPLYKSASEVMGYQGMLGSTIAGSRKYDITRGFSDEDLASGLFASADLQLLGRHSLSDASKGYAQNAGRVLSAARGVFGDIGGKGLIQNINSLIGSDTYDISNGGDADKVEKLLQNVKTTARIAGQSIDSLVNVIKTVRAVAQSHPELQYMSGGAVTDVVTKATLDANALNQIMNPTDVRRFGGVQGLQAGNAATALDLQTSLGSRLASTAAYRFVKRDASGNIISGGDIAGAIGAFSNTMMGQPDINRLVQSVANSQFHGNVQSAWLALTDPRSNALAQSDPTAALLGQAVGQKIPLNVFKQALGSNGRNAGDIYNKVLGIISGGGGQNEVEAYLQTNAPQGYTALNSRNMLDAFYKNAIFDTPQGKRVKAAQDIAVATTNRDASELDRIGADRYASPMQRFIQDVLGGKTKNISDTFESIKNIIGDADPAKVAHLDRIKGFLNGSDKSFDAAASMMSDLGAKGASGSMLQKVFRTFQGMGSFDQLKTSLAGGGLQMDNDVKNFILNNGLDNSGAFNEISKRGATGFAFPFLDQYRKQGLQAAQDKQNAVRGGEINDQLTKLYKDQQNPLAKLIMDTYGGDYKKYATDVTNGKLEDVLGGRIDLKDKKNADYLKEIYAGTYSTAESMTKAVSDDSSDVNEQGAQNDILTKILGAITNGLPEAIQGLTSAING